MKKPTQHEVKPTVVRCHKTPHRVLYYSHSTYCPCYKLLQSTKPCCMTGVAVLHDSYSTASSFELNLQFNYCIPNNVTCNRIDCICTELIAFQIVHILNSAWLFVWTLSNIFHARDISFVRLLHSVLNYMSCSSKKVTRDS